MAKIYMFDDINVALIPVNAKVVAYYVDGRYANGNEIRSKFPKAQLVSIATNPADDAEVLDVETGDATIADIYNWLKRQLARGVYRPGIYISGSRVDLMMLTMVANGFARDQYRIWSAHWGDGDHICGPGTCKVLQDPSGKPLETACDWTQFTNFADNSSLDESDLGTDEPVFTPPKAPEPKPPVVKQPDPIPTPPVPEPVTAAEAQAAAAEVTKDAETAESTLTKLEEQAQSAVAEVEKFIAEHK
jgi:hypothetical protein